MLNYMKKKKKSSLYIYKLLLYPVILWWSNFRFLSRSLLHCKIFNIQNLYPELSAIGNFLDHRKWLMQTKKVVYFPIFASFVTWKKPKDVHYMYGWNLRKFAWKFLYKSKMSLYLFPHNEIYFNENLI